MKSSYFYLKSFVFGVCIWLHSGNSLHFRGHAWKAGVEESSNKAMAEHRAVMTENWYETGVYLKLDTAWKEKLGSR